MVTHRMYDVGSSSGALQSTSKLVGKQNVGKLAVAVGSAERGGEERRGDERRG